MITELAKLIEKHEKDNPGQTGKVVFQLNYLGGKVESIQKFTYNMETVKVK